MKIVQLCPYAMARPGGVQRHVRDLSNWLTAQGHETRIIAPPSAGASACQIDNLFEIGRARSLGLHGTAFEIAAASPFATRALARELRAWGADLVHLHTPWTPFLVGQMHRALKLPTVTTIHATLPAADKTGLVDRYIRWSAKRFLQKSAAILTPSESPLHMLRTLIPGLDAMILPPCVDLSTFADAPGNRPKDEINLLFLGRLERRKGLDVLLDAWPKISAVLPHATLTIAGDGELRPRVQGAVQGRLIYVGRPDDAEVVRLMARAHFFMAPAPFGESYGLVLAEAMAAGAVPIAAANDGYASVLVGDGRALLVPPDDADAFAARIIALSQDPDRYTALRSWGRAQAKHSDVRGVGPRYIDLYRTVLTQSMSSSW